VSTTTDLANYARFLRNGAPQAFDDFVAAFARYTADTVQNMINASANLPVVQGHAQQCAKILNVLEEVKNGRRDG
jgi:hypothetical protein